MKTQTLLKLTFLRNVVMNQSAVPLHWQPGDYWTTTQRGESILLQSYCNSLLVNRGIPRDFEMRI